MVEQFSENNDENLSQFEDYLSEFKNIVTFDDETCPKCGVNVSRTMKLQNSPFIILQEFQEEDDVVYTAKLLDEKGLIFKVEKELNQKHTKEIKYIYKILVPFSIVQQSKEVLNNNLKVKLQ